MIPAFFSSDSFWLGFVIGFWLILLIGLMIFVFASNRYARKHLSPRHDTEGFTERQQEQNARVDEGIYS